MGSCSHPPHFMMPRRIEELEIALKQVLFQFEPLIQQVSEDHYLDDDVEALLVGLLKDAKATLNNKDNVQS